MTNPATGALTFLFTDVEGSSARWEQQPAAMSVALARHDEILRGAIQRHGGDVFKTVGDAFCAVFGSAADALAAALDAQWALQPAMWTAGPDGGPLRVRMALHTGAVEARGGDFFGPTVNRVARLVSAGHGGQVLVSEAAFALVRDDLPAGVSLLDLGEHRLKDLSRPERVFQLLAGGLPSGFPPLRTLDVRSNLPVQDATFIGREREIEALTDMLVSGRIVTLTGVGGTGKTRLALQVAAESASRYPHGTWFVDLAPLAEPALVPETVSAVFDLAQQPGQTMADTLCEYLASRELLLVLDNCEHLAEACARQVDRILHTAPSVSVLATSREPLQLAAEVCFHVTPLARPPEGAGKTESDAAALTQYEAVRLFADRAVAAKRDFHVTDANAPAVARICRRLDGLPLAIELAAAWVRLLTPEQISARLDPRLRMLSGGRRLVAPRHKTLRAAIDWSHELLSEPERVLFRRLAVFRGGWALEAAEAVCAGDGLDPTEIMALLGQLVDKSLVEVRESGGANRFRFLETIREYAGERAVESGTVNALAHRHLVWCVELAERAEAELQGPDQGTWLARLEVEHDNLRAALEWSRSTAGAADLGLRLAGALSRFWLTRGHLTEGRGYLGGLLALPETQDASPVRAKALHGLGALALQQCDYDAARERFQESLALKRATGDEPGIAETLRTLGTVAEEQGQRDEATTFYRQSLDKYRQLNSKWGMAACLNNLGLVLYHDGQYEAARPALQESLALFRQLDETWAVGVVLANLGSLALDEGELAVAGDCYDESLAIARELGDREGMASVALALAYLAYCRGDLARALDYLGENLPILVRLNDRQKIAEWLESRALVAAAEGDPAFGAALLGAADALRQEIVSPLVPKEQAERDALVERLRGALGDAAYRSARQEGRDGGWHRLTPASDP